MARVPKIDNAFKKRFAREEKSRAVATRDKRLYFLIVCEGTKTEPEYFQALEKELPPGSVELEIEGKGHSTISLVNYTISLRDKSRHFDRVWVVFDKDDFDEADFNSAIAKAEANNIGAAWTNEAFELWFLLHFQFRNTGMKRGEYQSCLEGEVRTKSGDGNYKYQKRDPKTYSILKQHGNQEQAIKWAKKLQATFEDKKFASHNPCTRVHELIEELLYPEEVWKKINGEE